MSKTIRTALYLGMSVVLCSALAAARAGGNSADQHKTKNPDHHGRFAKLAFWHHHHGNAKQAQGKHAQAKHAPVKAGHTKAAAATAPTGKKEHATSKAPAQKASVTGKKKPQEGTQDGTTASLKH